MTLSIRNLDRKINFLIKSRKHKEEATEMEEEEVYQFFDQTTNEENPLGQNKGVKTIFRFHSETKISI